MRLHLDLHVARAQRGAVRSGKDVRLPCPVHGSSRDSLIVGHGETGKPIWHCYAGCNSAEVRDALINLGVLIVEETETRYRPADREREKARKLEWCKRMWEEATSIYMPQAKPAYDYLISRGIHVRHAGECHPHALRWHPKRHAMLARITDSWGRGIGLHETHLNPHGGKSRKCHGTMKGGAIKLFGSDVVEVMAVAEGIETALAFAQLYPGIRPVWSLISSSGVAAFMPPPGVKRVIVATDFDGAGLTAYERLRGRLKRVCDVELRLPGGQKYYGKDWADMVKG